MSHFKISLIILAFTKFHKAKLQKIGIHYLTYVDPAILEDNLGTPQNNIENTHIHRDWRVRALERVRVQGQFFKHSRVDAGCL